MLRKRPSTSTTLLAWTVVNTRWPSERLDRNLRGLLVANLTDHDLVRVVAEDRRSPGANVRPFFSFTGICVMARKLVLDGVSIVTILSSTDWISDRQA